MEDEFLSIVEGMEFNEAEVQLVSPYRMTEEQWEALEFVRTQIPANTIVQLMAFVDVIAEDEASRILMKQKTIPECVRILNDWWQIAGGMGRG